MISDFTADWLALQKEWFPSIEGIFLLDDIVGFLGEADFKQSALPYLKRLFGCLDVPVRFFHNDAPGLVCAPFLPEIGVNLFNFGFEHSLAEMKQLTNNTVTLLGNIPPRDVLAQGTPEEVAAGVKAALESVEDHSRIILSCGGDVPSDKTSTHSFRPSEQSGRAESGVCTCPDCQECRLEDLETLPADLIYSRHDHQRNSSENDWTASRRCVMGGYSRANQLCGGCAQGTP